MLSRFLFRLFSTSVLIISVAQSQQVTVPAVSGVPQSAQVAAASIDPENIRAHVRFLSLDLQARRGSGKRDAERIDFWPTVESVAREFDLQLLPDPTPGAGHYYRSDHFLLARVGVPAFSVDQRDLFEEHNEAWGRAQAEDYVAHHYHQPPDEFHADWDFRGNAKLARFGFVLGWLASAQSHSIEWQPGNECEEARKQSEGKLQVNHAAGDAAKRPPMPAVRIGADADRMGFVTAEGRSFEPQGVNWVQVSPGTYETQHEVSFKPDYYPQHRELIHQSLQQIAKDGFNYVRIRLDARTISAGVSSVGLSHLYMENVVDLIRAAAANGLYVELAAQWLPDNYYQLASQMGLPEPDKHNTSGINELLFSRAETYAYGRYIADILSMIRTEDPSLISAIFCVDIWNELGFESGDLPFSRESGEFVDENGTRTDLSDATARQKLVDAATVRWINGVIDVARTISPQTLFTSSVFSPIDVARSGYVGVKKSDSKWGDPRQPFRLSAIEESKVDFLEIHLYPFKAGGYPGLPDHIVGIFAASLPQACQSGRNRRLQEPDTGS